MKKRANRMAKREKLARDMTMRERIAMDTLVAIINKVPPQTTGVNGWTNERADEWRASCINGAINYADDLISMLRAREVKQ